MSESPKCPVHGFVMCEVFENVPSEDNSHVIMAIPTGKYVCYYCADKPTGVESGKESQS